MNAIETLYRNSGLITEDGYVKVRDGLWVKSGPYQEQTWDDADKSILPSKEELHEIYLKLQELIQTQEACGLDSLRQILEGYIPWVWSSTEYSDRLSQLQRMNDGNQYSHFKNGHHWIVPIRRSPWIKQLPVLLTPANLC